MKTTCCPVCGSLEHEIVFAASHQPLARYGLCKDQSQALKARGYPLQIVRCPTCGVLFNKDFDFSTLDYGSEGVQESRVFSPRIREHMMESAKLLNAALTLKDDVILEIGCGEGFFIGQFAADNTCIAFEPSPEGYEAEKRGVLVHHRYFDPTEKHAFAPKLVIMRQVLEHLERPTVYLKAICELLMRSSEAAYLYIEVPNSSKTIAERRFHDFYYEHFAYFTTASLVNLLERTGFRVVSARETFDGEILEVLCAPARIDEVRLPRELQARRERYISLIDQYLRDGKKVAAWGTAGNGCAFMNLCGFTTDKIELVVDSDPRKQGYYLPGTGQRVVSPETLVADPPDVILILSQFHKADIAAQINALFRSPPSIITIGA